VPRQSCHRLLKNIHRISVLRSTRSQDLRHCADPPSHYQKQKARNLSVSGPLKTELGGCA